MNEFIKSQFNGFVVPVDIFNVPGLDIYEQSAYIVLQSFSNPHTAMAFPSYNDIAKFGRMSRRKAVEAVKSLFEKGLISKESRIKYSKEKRSIINDSNTYTLLNPSTLVHDVHQGGSAHGALVHDVHQGGSAHGAPLILKEIILKEIDRLIDADAIKFYLISISEKLEKEHIELINRTYQLQKDREEFSIAMFIEKIEKTIKAKVKNNFFGYLNKSVERELVKIKAEKEQLKLECTKKGAPKAHNSSVKPQNRKKPHLPVVKSIPSEPTSPEVREAILQLARSLDEGRTVVGTADMMILDEERPF